MFDRYRDFSFIWKGNGICKKSNCEVERAASLKEPLQRKLKMVFAFRGRSFIAKNVYWGYAEGGR